jgi:hypothetical protein
MQVGLLVEQARLALEAGLVDEFLVAADDAADYARHMGLEEAAIELKAMTEKFKS